MDDTPDQASAARAARLHHKIEELKASAKAETDGDKPSVGESPREFVHRRMREIAEAERDEQADPDQDDVE